MTPTLAGIVRRIAWLLVAGAALAALILFLLPTPAPPVYERPPLTPAPTAAAAAPTVTPLLLATPLVSFPPATTTTAAAAPDRAIRRRAVNQQAPYCCSNWSVWVNSIEITDDGLLRLDASIHNDTLWDGVTLVADPLLLDESGRSYPARRDLTVTFGAERVVPPASSVTGAFFFVAPPADVKMVDFLYAGGYQWVRRIEVP